jgi:hypothetical protein
MDEVDRDDLIDLLEQLGSADDAEVLAAARELHRRVSEAGLTWDDLLAWPDEDEEEPEFELDAEEVVDEQGSPPAAGRRTPASGASAAPADVNSLGDAALIDRILGECDVSDETRQDLLDLKGDIGRGEFTDMDRKYIRALYSRLRPAR